MKGGLIDLPAAFSFFIQLLLCSVSEACQDTSTAASVLFLSNSSGTEFSLITSWRQQDPRPTHLHDFPPQCKAEGDSQRPTSMWTLVSEESTARLNTSQLVSARLGSSLRLASRFIVRFHHVATIRADRFLYGLLNGTDTSESRVSRSYKDFKCFKSFLILSHQIKKNKAGVIQNHLSRCEWNQLQQNTPQIFHKYQCCVPLLLKILS